jgi:hypothetical protein
MTLQALAGHVQFIGRTASSSGPRHTAARLLGRLAALCCGDWREALVTEGVAARGGRLSRTLHRQVQELPRAFSSCFGSSPGARNQTD